jgi:4-hydroxy-tetrahydrodipicolinate reductase
MGTLIISEVLKRKGMKLVAAVDRPGIPSAGKDVGDVADAGKTGVKVSGSDKLDEVISASKPDVMVDFTRADAAVSNMQTATAHGVNLVVGTTGIPGSSLKSVEKSVKKKGTSAVISPNMATGVNAVFESAKRLGKLLPGYDIEILEAHHKGKLDSPSGTAIRLGEILSESTGKKFVFGRKGRSKRGKEIGFHSIRAGDIAGEHTILFAGPGERIELTHRASSRQPFVNGVIMAIEFAAGKRDGKVHGMKEVLGIPR